MKRQLKVILPDGCHTRRLPLGIGSGLRMNVNLRDGHIGLYLGLYEMELNRHLRRLCYRGARSFDLGGHIGYDALILAKLSGSSVLTVECSSTLCERIRMNARSNPELEELIYVLMAYVDKVPERAGHVTIDAMADEFFVPDFIKMDIEGGEGEALLGAENLLTSRRPGLLIEVHSAEVEAECLHVLRRHGYTPEVVDQRRVLRDHRPAAHNRWLIAAGDVTC